jgi:hypothetical protein
MQKKCDLYLCADTDVSQIKMLRLFDKDVLPEKDTVRSGYLFVNVERVKLVAVVSDLRRRGVPCFSVPIEYRNSVHTYAEAFEIAQKHAAEQGVLVAQIDQERCPPLYWSFRLICIGLGEQKAGGILMVDRLDGHVWSQNEYEEYMYDYNNIF